MEFALRPPVKILSDLEGRTEIFDLLKTSAGASSVEFENRYAPLINSLASYLLETPLERTAFAEPGGAMRFALTAAAFALRMAAHKIFAPTVGSEVRRAVDKQYKFAAFAATIATVPTLVHTKVQVTSGPDKTNVWAPFHSHPHLEDWVRVEGDGRSYEVLWRTADTVYPRSSAVAISAEIFQRGFWSFFHPMVVHDMYEAIAPQDKVGREGPLWLCVHEGMKMARLHEQRAETAPYVETEMPPGVSAASIVAAAPPPAPTPALVTPPEQPPVQASSTNEASLDASTKSTKPVAPHGTPIQAVHPSAPTQTDSPPVSDVESTGISPDHPPEVARAIALAARLPIVLREAFDAVRTKPDFEKLKGDFKRVEDGIEIPLKTLYGLGTNPSALFDQLKDLNLVVRKGTAGGAGARITLIPEIEYLLTGEAVAHL